MKRNVVALKKRRFDIAIIGGGIYGACIAWDAALRGLSVALLERGDFGHATSANSLKIIHGGLRYIQDGKLGLMRAMINERRAFFRIAPHLVHPLPCVTPTYSDLSRSRWAFSAALSLNDLVGFDRNQQVDAQKALPRGYLISRADCQRLLPDIDSEKLTGAAVWYDGQMYNSERLTLAFVLSAAQAGAVTVNYVEAEGFLRSGRQIQGVKAMDLLSGDTFRVHADLVINAAGPWTDELLQRLSGRPGIPKFQPSLAVNLVTRQIFERYAVGLPSRLNFVEGRGIPRQKSRLLFIAPWRGYSLIGTFHFPYGGRPDETRVSPEQIQDMLAEVNAAFPAAELTPLEVHSVQAGLLPAEAIEGQEIRLVREGQIFDHATEDQIQGLITVLGVKYTAARLLAERAVDLALQKLGRPPISCRTAHTPIYGGQIPNFGAFLQRALDRDADLLGEETVRHLVYHYGSNYGRVVAYARQNGFWKRRVCEKSQVIFAEILNGVRYEMAQKLSDVILRRTELGTAFSPQEECLSSCAKIMAMDLDWDPALLQREIREMMQARSWAPKPLAVPVGNGHFPR